jgi:hypothetical protein
MGCEQRKGRTYYYKKKRLGNRVVSEYLGGGTFAILAESRAREEATAAAAKRKLIKQKREEIIKTEIELDRVLGWIEILSSSELVLYGYHQHKGEWRKRQNECFIKKDRSRGRKTNQPH